MKILKNKIAAIMIALILMLSMTASLIIIPARALELPTLLIISVSPNPAGVGQSVYVAAFTTNPPPTANRMMGDRWEGMTIEVTHPDGTKETLGPYHSDSTGGIGIAYVPTTIGNYTFQAFFPEQKLTGRNPYDTGAGANLDLVGTIMKSSQSSKVTLAVQEELAKNVYQSPPLPTEYWSRPIYSTNFAWAALGGNWFGMMPVAAGISGGYDASGNVQLYSTAPNTAHILWTKPISFGGQVGAPMNADQESMYFGVTRTVRQWEGIAINGILYYADMPDLSTAAAPVISNWVAVDLRTGETLWTKEFPVGMTEDLRMGQVLEQRTYTEYGAMSYLWSKIGSTFKIYEPLTGMYLANITGVTDMPFLADFDTNEQGTALGYYTSNNATGTYLNLWNSTQAFAYPNGFDATTGSPWVARLPGEPLGRLRITGSYPWSAGLKYPGGWSVLLPGKLDGNNISLSIGAITHDVILMRYAPLIGGQVSTGSQIVAGYDARTGNKLWGPINQTIPFGEVNSVLCARDGVYVLNDKDTLNTWGYSLTNGQLLWGPVKLSSNAFSIFMVGAEIAYGNVYIWNFGGFVDCLDLKTGAIKWTFTPRSAGTDTAYGIYPIWCNTGTICDGKIFLGETHLYTPPMFPGAKRLVINATTGELVWSVLSFPGKSFAVHADGMMVQCNCYDKLIYTFGKGPTATTVTASPEVSVQGSSILIKGIVTDESAGTKNPDRIARFPNGVPAVSDESMSPWMEYVYMQQPKPTNTTGVTVTLSVVDSNNNLREIGTTTSDADGFYSFQWVPDIPGAFTVKASYMGSESYWPSHAVTSFAVDAASPTLAPTAEPLQSMADQYFVPAVAGIIVVILIGFAVLGLLVLRKRP
jgi:hypothetical protein